MVPLCMVPLCMVLGACCVLPGTWCTVPSARCMLLSAPQPITSHRHQETGTEPSEALVKQGPALPCTQKQEFG